MIAIAPIDEWAPLEWPGMNAAFLASFLGAIALTLVAIPYGKRRPVGTRLSWGEAMLAATYAFGVMFLGFGVAPHQWITHANVDLDWSRDRLIFGPSLPFLHDPLRPQALGGWFPMTLQYEAIRDIVVVLIHVVYFGLLIFIWVWWQKRGQVKTTEVEVSSFGRPLVKKA